MPRANLLILLLWTAIVLYAASVLIRLAAPSLIARAACGGGM